MALRRVMISGASAPTASIVHTRLSLDGIYGASGVTESAVDGRTDWTNDTNATGKRNGTIATMSGDALGARGGQLDLAYADFPNKAPLTLTAVSVRYYFRITGANVALPDADVRLKYSVGGPQITLATFASNVDHLSGGIAYDLFAAGLTTWSALDSFTAHVYASSSIAETWVVDLDAVHLAVVGAAPTE